MKTKQLFLCLVGIICASVFYPQSAKADNSPRRTVNFNRDWKYAQGDFKGADILGFNDSEWEAIGLPHSFSIPYFMSKDFYVGYGWYRKQFSLTKDEALKNLFLEFDGVFQEAEVYVNGLPVGNHVGGYTGFCINISSAVRAGNNLVAVRVNNNWKPTIAPRAGEHVFSGGIYRNVRLVMKGSVFVDWCGTMVTTPDLQANLGKSSVVEVSTDISSCSNKAGSYKLVTEILDKKGKVMASASTTVALGVGSTKQLQQKIGPIKNPSLWSPENPELYKVVSSLYRGRKLIDREETNFGFRWMEWTADKGFFLNGEHRFLKGANVHQDHAGWGDAVTESGMRRDVRLMKEAGFDFIRGSHYPHAPAFSRACDEEGMLFWSEAPFWGIGGFKPDGYWDCSAYPVDEKDCEEFERSSLQQLEEMIRIHRNHPSIIAWSMCNEPFFSAPEVMPGVERLLKKMVELSRRLDPNRPAAVGGVQRPLGKGRIDKIGDIAGYNGDGCSISDFQNPGVPNLVSEYGSTTADRPGKYEPGWGDLHKNNAWKGHPWRSGQAIWCGFDHGSIAGSQLGKMGIVDYFRIPKRAWYWYRNEYRNIAPPQWATEGVPARIRLEASQTTGVRADGTEDVMLNITILDREGKEISNSPTVTLTLVSGPGEFPTGTSITFDKDSDIRIMDGKAAIEFRSFYSGTSVIEATSPGLESARAEITFTHAPAFAESTTSQITNRPYVRFVKAKPAQEIIQTFGRNNPTFASSAAVGHPAGYAADGNEQTYWEADENDEDVFWTLDTEKGLALRDVKIIFAKSLPHKYIIETSGDNLNWALLKDRSKNEKSIQTEQISVMRKDKNRFVRIRFNKYSSTLTPAITEVIVKGVVLE